MGAKPVVFLSLVKNDLQRGNPDGKEGKPDIVKAPKAGDSPGRSWRVLHKLKDQKQGQNANRDVDVEDPPP